MLKLKKKWLVLFIVTVILTILWISVIGYYHDYHSLSVNLPIGNKPSMVEALKENGLPFSFFVIGDTQGTDTAEKLIELALQKSSPAFMVNLGDFVKRPDIWEHRFFLTEMITELKPAFPVFLVEGNHDLDYKLLREKPSKRLITPEIYESLYGSRNFDFVFNNCLFIICGIDAENPTVYLNYLRDTLSKKSENKKHVFVFIHRPVPGLNEHLKTTFPYHEEFLSILASYKGIYCFSGDYHGYLRVQRKGINFIVSGGGGGNLRETSAGNFYHILHITVDTNEIAEEIITTKYEFSIENYLEEKSFTLIFPIIGNKAWVFYVILAVLIIVMGYTVVKIFQLRLRNNSNKEDNSH